MSEKISYQEPCTSLYCQNGRDTRDNGICHICNGAGTLTRHKEYDDEELMRSQVRYRGGERDDGP